MRQFLCLLALTFLSLAAFSQRYAVGHRQVTWNDSTRANRPVRTEVYYPAATNGDDVPVAPDGKRFPVVVFGHGFQLTYTSYLWLKDSLVPRGFIVAFPRTEEVLFPDHATFARDIAFLVTVFNTERTKPGSWLAGRVLPRYAVSGHSMGGGCALLSVQYNRLITAVIPFAAAETNPSAIAASAGISIPAVIIAGKADCVTPPSTNQLPMYANIGGPCKTYIEIDKAKHCHWANNNGTCTLGELFCGGFSTSPATTLRTTMSFVVPWLNAALYRNLTELQRFNALLSATGNITYQQSCTIAAATEIAATPEVVATPSLKLYPVPVQSGGVLHLQLPAGMQGRATVIITDQVGMKEKELNLNLLSERQISIPTMGLRKGIHFLLLQQGTQRFRGTFTVE